MSSPYGYDPGSYESASYPGPDPYGPVNQSPVPQPSAIAQRPAAQGPAPAYYPVQPVMMYSVPPQAMKPDHPSSGAVFALGLISILLGGITGPFAWAIGSKARKEIQQNPGQYRESGMLTAGWVMGIIGTIFLILNVLALIAYVLFYVWFFAMLIGYSSY